MEKIDLKDVYPVSENRIINSSRRLAREKVLQTIYAESICETDVSELIEHIFYRVFNFDDYEQVELVKDKLLNPKQIQELESDTTIEWTEEHLEFAKNLLKSVLLRKVELNEYLTKYSSDWQPDRISSVDKYIILIAITEMLDFEEIPPKVSINEALDISKLYSEQKSKTFINGILDTIYKKMQSDGTLKKSGRGLLDNKDVSSEEIKVDNQEDKEDLENQEE